MDPTHCKMSLASVDAQAGFILGNGAAQASRAVDAKIHTPAARNTGGFTITSPAKRNVGLDALRGIAILLVLGNHIAPDTIQHLPALQGFAGAVYWQMRCIGWTGVDLFFVLSGYLISGLLFQEIESSGTVRCGRFWVRRAFKILPSYYFLLLMLAVTGATTWLDVSSASTVLTSVAQHCLFLQNYLAHSLNGPTWSLAVEEHFYLVLPVLLLLLARGVTRERFLGRVLVAGVLVLVGALALRTFHAFAHGNGLDDYRRTHFRIDSLFIGVLTQLLARRGHFIARWVVRRPGLSLGLAAALVSPAMVLGTMHPLMFSVGYTALAIGFALVVLVFAQGLNFAQPLPPMRALAAIGTWSYNIFLWNFFVALLPLPGYGRAQAWLAIHSPNAAFTVAAQGLLFVAVAIGIGALATKLVEGQFLKLREWCTAPKLS